MLYAHKKLLTVGPNNHNMWKILFISIVIYLPGVQCTLIDCPIAPY